jgi:hypothetical protein
VDYNKKHELLRSIRPFKCVMIPNSVDEISEIGLEGLYVALIDRVTVEIIDSEGRRIGIVGGEIQDGGCRRAFPIYLRDLIQCKDALAVRDEAHLMYKIEQLVDYGRICVRPQDGGYVIGVFNCMRFESCPTQVVEKRYGEWDDFFREVLISAVEVRHDRSTNYASTRSLPLPTMTRTPDITSFRDSDYCKFDSTDPQEVFERARNIIFQMGTVGSYHWALEERSNSSWEELAAYKLHNLLSAVRVYALKYNAPFGCKRDVTWDFISKYNGCHTPYQPANEQDKFRLFWESPMELHLPCPPRKRRGMDRWLTPE